MLPTKLTTFGPVRIHAVNIQLETAFSQAACNLTAGLATREIETEPLLASYDADFNETNIYPERLLKSTLVPKQLHRCPSFCFKSLEPMVCKLKGVHF